MGVYEKFVARVFAEIPLDRRRWFLNWGSIQSVPGLEVCLNNSEDIADGVAFSCFVEGCG